MKAQMISSSDIDKLRNELRKHAYLYYTLAQPEMSDYNYDMLFKSLEKIESEHPELVTPDSPTQLVGGGSANIYAEQLRKKQMKNRKGTTLADLIGGIVGCVFVLGVIAFAAYCPYREMTTYNKFRDPGTPAASYMDAVFSELRITTK